MIKLIGGDTYPTKEFRKYPGDLIYVSSEEINRRTGVILDTVKKAFVNGEQVYPHETGPEKIKIISMPCMTDCSDIVVQAYYQDGSIYNTPKYPNGIIPFEELDAQMIYRDNNSGWRKTLQSLGVDRISFDIAKDALVWSYRKYVGQFYWIDGVMLGTRGADYDFRQYAAGLVLYDPGIDCSYICIIMLNVTNRNRYPVGSTIPAGTKFGWKSCGFDEEYYKQQANYNFFDHFTEEGYITDHVVVPGCSLDGGLANNQYPRVWADHWYCSYITLAAGDIRGMINDGELNSFTTGVVYDNLARQITVENIRFYVNKTPIANNSFYKGTYTGYDNALLSLVTGRLNSAWAAWEPKPGVRLTAQEAFGEELYNNLCIEW